jgi:hypothetical protein
MKLAHFKLKESRRSHMESLFGFFFIWLFASIPLGILAGKMMSLGSAHDYDDDAPDMAETLPSSTPRPARRLVVVK